MNNYVRYRNWWSKHQYESFYQSEPFEVAFAEHINSMTLYELMETLEGWGEEDRLKAVPDFSDDEGWEDRSAIQGTNPGLAELIKERQEAIAKESTRIEALTHEEKAKIVEEASKNLDHVCGVK